MLFYSLIFRFRPRKNNIYINKNNKIFPTELDVRDKIHHSKLDTYAIVNKQFIIMTYYLLRLINTSAFSELIGFVKNKVNLFSP